MSILRYSEGGVTVTLNGDLERIARAALDAAAGETVRIMEAAAETQRAESEGQWYAPGTGVTRQTGASGKLAVVTTVSDSEVRVSLGSTDTRMVKNRRGSMVQRALVIQRPGVLSLVDKLVTQGEWWAWKNAGKPVGKAGTAGETNWTIKEPNPLASDGKALVPELIRKPMKARVKVITPELGRAIAARATKGR